MTNNTSADSYLRDESGSVDEVTPQLGVDGVVAYGLADSAKIPIVSAEQITADYCMKFMRAVRDCSFATVDEDGLPSVRVIDVMLVRDGRIYFLAPRGKSFYSEVMRTGQVAIVAQTVDFRMCRLRGSVVHENNPEEQKRLVDMLFEVNPGMDELYPDDSRYVIEAFYIEEGSGEYFDLGQNPLVRVPFRLGEGAKHERGYFITDECIGCGICASKCPRSCISGEPGHLHLIDQQSCLHCGLCYEACPHGAIQKRG